MKETIQDTPVSVRLLALPESMPSSIFGLLEVFQAVGVVWNEVTGETTVSRHFDARIVARDLSPIASPAGPEILPQARISDDEPCDIIIVTDLNLHTLEQLNLPGRWTEEAKWLRTKFDEGSTICSVCTGAVVLAEAGMLDGLEATTHWAIIDFFRTKYPAVIMRPERILCPSGPGHRIITGGGPGSREDLALYLVGRFGDPAEAVRISKVFVFGDRSNGQLLFSAMGRPQSHADAAIGDCQTWVADNYAKTFPVRQMLERSGMAERTFKRRFRAATGYTPVEYVQALRIEEAKQLLEASEDTTEEIANAVGYDDPAFFRRLFKRMTGVTPSRYRNQFSVPSVHRI